jgi:MFS family permease
MAATPPATVPRRLGLALAVVQFLFALTWTVYVIFLPALAAQLGLPKQAVALVLLADQLIFVATDYLLGVAADRVAARVGRLGLAIAGVTLVSCAALLLLPWAAPQGSPSLFLGLVVVWAATSSALRAPPLVLLGKHAARPSLPWLASLTLLGLGLASALAPYLTLRLRDLDPRAPFALSSLALLLATWGLVQVERQLAARPAVPASVVAPPPEPAPQARRLGWFLGASALLALGSQVHQFLNSPALYLRHATPAQLPYVSPVFWIGFSLLLLPASAATRRHGALLVMGVGGVVAALAAGLAQAAGSLTPLLVLQWLAGGAWGCVLSSAVTAALDIGHVGREGRACGGLYSMLALAAAARIALAATGVDKLPAFGAARAWTPVAAWTVAGVLLLWLAAVQRRRVVPGT